MGQEGAESSAENARKPAEDEVASRIRKSLIRLRHLGLGRAESSRNLLATFSDELFRDASFGDFVLRDLGIYIAGFLYLQHDRNVVRYEFFSQSSGTEAQYMIPYQWLDGNRLDVPSDDLAQRAKTAEASIDALFLVQRKLQSPWFPRRAQGQSLEPLLPPEFVSALPHAKTPDDPDARLRDPAFGYGWHYCEYGSMLYHLYAWRLLVRYAMAVEGGFEQSLAEFDPAQHWSYVGNSQGFPLLNANCRLGGFEKRFAEALNGKLAEHFDSKAQHSLSGANKLIQHCEREDHSGRGWWSDWLRLLLLNSIQRQSSPVGPGLEPLIRYLAQGRHSDLAQDLDPAQYRNRDLSSKELGNLDSRFRQAVVRDYGAESGRIFEVDALLGLHECAHFPIAPYFYWNWIDRVPKTHLVLPVWYSFNHPGKQGSVTKEP